MGSIKSFFRRFRHRRSTGSNSTAATTTTSTSRPSSPTATSDLKRVFEKFDENGDGKISSSELSAIFETLGHRPTPSELQSMMLEADSDGDGFISLEEFVELNTRGVNDADALEDLKLAFSVFDMDKNGSISADELASVLTSLGEGASVAECRKMIGGVDRNGDGMIDFDEFRAMMASRGSLFPTNSSVRTEIMVDATDAPVNCEI